MLVDFYERIEIIYKIKAIKPRLAQLVDQLKHLTQLAQLVLPLQLCTPNIATREKDVLIKDSIDGKEAIQHMGGGTLAAVCCILLDNLKQLIEEKAYEMKVLEGDLKDVTEKWNKAYEMRLELDKQRKEKVCWFSFHFQMVFIFLIEAF